MVKETLKELGLSDKEAKVYLAMIELGSAPVSAIAKQAKIKRPTTYVVLDMLSEKGLVGFEDRRGSRLYSPAPLEQLVGYFREASKRYAGFADAAKKILPELKSVQGTKRKEGAPEPRVQVFEGVAAMRTVYGDILSSLEGIRGEKAGAGSFRARPATGREFGTVSEIMVHGSKIILVSPEEKFAAVVESRELAIQL